MILQDRKQRLKTFYIALSRKHKQILESPDLLSREDRDRVLDHCCKRLKVLHREICQVTSLEKGKDTAIDARQTQPARFPLIHGCSHGGLVAGLSDEEVRIGMCRDSFNSCVLCANALACIAQWSEVLFLLVGIQMWVPPPPLLPGFAWLLCGPQSFLHSQSSCISKAHSSRPWVAELD